VSPEREYRRVQIPGPAVLARVTSEQLFEALQRSRVVEQMSGQGTEVRVISRIHIASEWVVFSMHEGSSAATVRQLNQRAGIPINRI